ncbi:MAG: helix-turn-helix transcriptional regulator [Spirochaetales bacterium]|nr:helix-turn-helix transcriptional regulator [Spirochaetales bacterium]
MTGVREGGSSPFQATLQNLADFFSVLGDPTRLKILFALFGKERCVSAISFEIGMNQSAVSHQLRILKQNRIVRYRKEGKVIFYSLSDLHVEEIVDRGLTHMQEREGTG